MKTLRSSGRSVMTVLSALLVAAALGYLNLHNDEVQVPLLMLLVSSFLLGYINRWGTWSHECAWGAG